MANPSVVRLVWLWMTLVIAFYDKRRLQANAQANGQDPSQQLQVCHEDHGRCIRDATFQNCSESSHAPKISHKDLVNITVTVNTVASFKCVQETLAGSLDPPQFDWVKWNPNYDSTLDIDHGKFTIIDMDSKYKITSAAEGHHHISNLIIHNVTLNDSGLYSCVVCNQYGRDYRTVSLSLEMTPAVFSTTKVPFLESSTRAASTPVISTKFPFIVPSTPAESSGVSQQTVIILGSLGAMAGLIVIVFMIYVAWKKRGGGKMQQNLPVILQESNLMIEAEENMPPSPTYMASNGQVAVVHKRNSSYRSQLSSVASAGTVITYTDAEFEYPLDEKWEVPRGSIAIKELAGEGAFGYVAKAEAFDLPNMPSPCTVAVKMLKENASDVELSDLISEMETMKEIGTHKNIVNFLGACTIQGPLLLIVEFCPYGNLRDFLRSNRPSLIDDKKAQLLTFRDLLSIAYQITRGMSYLSSKKCIHRDLAARNILIAEDFVIKIADFGLSRNLGSTEYYRKTSHGRLPVKWLAIEALFDQQYTIKSDVWSFGILLWEIFTLGGTPYPGIPVERLFTLLKNGYRMECPINCPPNIYETMLHCWSETAKSRPSFAELYEKLDGFLSAETALEYVAVLAQSVDCLAEMDTTESQQTPDRSFSKTSTNKINTVV